MSEAEAEVAWFVYDLRLDENQNRYILERNKIVYTKFEAALLKITRSEAGDESAFLSQLQDRLNKSRRNDGTTNESLTAIDDE